MSRHESAQRRLEKMLAAHIVRYWMEEGRENAKSRAIASEAQRGLELLLTLYLSVYYHDPSLTDEPTEVS